MDTFDIDSFGDSENIYLIPPYIKDGEKLLACWKEQNLSGHIFLCSSGTTGKTELKSYAISKQALLENARAVNSFLGASRGQKWLASLPIYHVGGLSIWARSYLLNSLPVVPVGKWNVDWFQLGHFEYASLVPFQLYDLIKADVVLAKEIKGIFIGGDFCPQEMVRQGLELGYPLIGTFGMTEVCSQLASKYLDWDEDGFLEILPIHKIHDGVVTSKSICTLEIMLRDDEVNVKRFNGKYHLQDKYELDGHRIKPLGRSDGLIKIKGRLVLRHELESSAFEIFNELDLYKNCALVFAPDDVWGSKPLVLLEASRKDEKVRLESAISKSQSLKPFVAEVRVVDKIQRTALGKIKKY